MDALGYMQQLRLSQSKPVSGLVEIIQRRFVGSDLLGRNDVVEFNFEQFIGNGKEFVVKFKDGTRVTIGNAKDAEEKLTSEKSQSAVVPEVVGVTLVSDAPPAV